MIYKLIGSANHLCMIFASKYKDDLPDEFLDTARESGLAKANVVMTLRDALRADTLAEAAQRET